MTDIAPAPRSLDGLSAWLDRNPGFGAAHPDPAIPAVREALALDGVRVEELRAYQRVNALDRSRAGALRLLELGFTSALQVARIPRRQFVERYAGALGKGRRYAARLHRRATRIRAKVMHLWATMHGVVASPHARALRTNNAKGAVEATFQTLPSYQDLFGSLNYYQCAECESIFGPAAYLVDLLRIIDERITQANPDLAAALRFDSRRPDIGQIPLTCAETFTLVPYLQIVDERLTATAATALGIAPGAVEKALSTAVFPWTLPFDAPLAAVRAYLGQAGTTLPAVYAAWNVTGVPLSRETLGLSPAQLALATTSLAGQPGPLAAHYGVAEAELPSLAATDRFLAQTGLDIARLRELVYQGLSDDELAAGIADNFFVNGDLRAAGKWLAITDRGVDGSTIDNLGNPELDRLDRFARLAAAAGWAYAELDWALRAAVQGEPRIPAEAEPLGRLASFAPLAARLRVDRLTLLAMVGPLKTYGGPGATQFDRVYNDPARLGGQPAYHPAGDPLNPLYRDALLHWVIGGSGDADRQVAARLTSSLQLGTDALNALGASLFPAPPADGVPLDVANLSALYRHARLAAALALPVDQYLVLLSACGCAGKTLLTPDDLASIAGALAWIRQARLTLYEVDYFVAGRPSPYVDPRYRPAEVGPWLESLWALAAAAAPGTQDDQLLEQLAILFGAAQDTVAAVMAAATPAVALPGGVTRWQDAFLAVPADPTANPYRPYIDAVLAQASRWLVAATRLGLSPAAVANLAAYPLTWGFGATLTPLTLDNLRSLAGYRALEAAFGDTSGQLLGYFGRVQAGATAGEQADALAAATGWSAAQIQALLTGVWPGVDDLVSRVTLLQASFGAAAALGADVAFMTSLAGMATLDTSRWDAYVALAAATRSQVAGLYDAAAWPGIATTLDGDLAALLRDALLGLVLWELHGQYPGITAPRNVYEYLLIDVETGPPVQTSYIREALSAAQLYLQRCRLRLEPGVEHVDIPPSWWTYLLDYRLWEANRQVYLYPENYLLPSVRRTKTELFRALENELQQSDLTDGYVEDAFKQYLDGFTQVAKLHLVDSCHCTVRDPLRGDTDTLFLFGRTGTQPATFYLAKREDGNTWSQWSKIDLNINSLSVTPLYAFNKLFIFWVELRATTNSSITAAGGVSASSNSTVWKATLLYSFQNHLGQWVPAQPLVTDEVVYYDAPGTDDGAAEGPFAGLFQMESPPWQKVYAFKTASGNVRQPSGPAVDFEKVSVLYGPLLRVSTPPLSTTTLPARGQDADKFAFDWRVYERTQDVNRVVLGRNTGMVPFVEPVSLTTSLTDESLLIRNEFLVLRTGAVASPHPPFNVQAASLSNVVQLVASQDVIYDNYLNAWADDYQVTTPATPVTATSFQVEGITAAQSQQVFDLLTAKGLLGPTGFVAPSFSSAVDLAAVLAPVGLSGAQVDAVRRRLFQAMGTVVLFGAVASERVRVLPVRNQPGWMVFDNGDESFLLTLPDATRDGVTATPVFEMIDDGMAVQRPPVAPASFAIAGIDAPVAQKVFDDLRSYGAVDAAGFPNLLLSSDINFISAAVANEKLTTPQTIAVQSVLLDGGVAFADSFVVPGQINAATSQAIFTALSQYSVIDANQRVNPTLAVGPLVNAALANLVPGQLSTAQVPAVYRKLLEMGAMVELAYANPVPDAGLHDLHDYRFAVTRTSTGAVDSLSRRLFVGGVPLLLSLSTQQAPVRPVLPFERLRPAPYNLAFPTALDGAQVDFDGLYGNYYWEVFYHAPMLLADALGTSQRFDAALTWFQYVFDPTRKESFVQPDTFAVESGGVVTGAQSLTIYGELQALQIGTPPAPVLDAGGRVNPAFTAQTPLGSLLGGAATALQQTVVRNVLLNYEMAAPSDRYWQFQPFRNYTQESLRWILSDANPAIRVYENDPFDPHAIARLRIGAYEKATVMQYIDLLIAWGDALFTQDTVESINSATMLYIYAYDLLGPRPVDLGPAPARAPMTFDQIRDEYRKQGQEVPVFLIDLEHIVPPGDGPVPPGDEGGPAFNDLHTYFCVPENQKLVGCWDTLEDRLHKIRNSMNIEGEVRQLALFEPPVNPLDLVRAAAASGGFLPASAGKKAAVPVYRFTTVLERARAVTGQVMDLGGKLLAALEKQDAEALAMLRTTQEAQMLVLSTSIREYQVTAAQETLAGLQAALGGAQNRVDHYAALLSNGYLPAEQVNLDAMAAALAFNILSSALRAGAAIAYTIPQVGSPFAMTFGGIQVGSSLTAASAAAEIGSEISTFIAQRSMTVAGYERREEDWTLARQNAEYEVQGLQAQILATQAQIASARQELALQQRSIEQNARVYDYLKDKFTSADLYRWLAGRVASVYMQTYRLALELAAQAQTAWQFELNRDDTFVAFGYWDSLRKGLAAGENLAFSLAQMEAAYLAGNRRALEIERTVSLAAWDPQALWTLQRTGSCEFALTEALFDYDFPGHYNRQIKTLSLSIPAVVGPYQNLKATLSQTYSAVVTAPDAAVVEWLLTGSGPVPGKGLRQDWAAPGTRQIAVSRGVDDSGVFQLDLRDERYLPFEGTGAVSRWKLEMPRATNRFDFSAISDVVVTVKYTAVDGGSFRTDVEKLLAGTPYPGALFARLSQAFSAQWAAFMNDHARPDAQTLSFPLPAGPLAWFTGATLTDVWLRLDAPGIQVPDGSEFLSLAIAGEPAQKLKEAGGIGHLGGLQLQRDQFVGTWTVTVDLAVLRGTPALAGLLGADGFLDPARFQDLELVLSYQGTVF